VLGVKGTNIDMDLKERISYARTKVFLFSGSIFVIGLIGPYILYLYLEPYGDAPSSVIVKGIAVFSVVIIVIAGILLTRSFSAIRNTVGLECECGCVYIPDLLPSKKGKYLVDSIGGHAVATPLTSHAPGAIGAGSFGAGLGLRE